MALRWGIVSAGLIANDFTTVLSSLPSSEHQVVAVAARDLNRAEEFAQKFNIPKAYGSYEELAAGKAVLCEKPMGVNAAEVREMVAKARFQGVFLMEAIWSRFFPAMEALREVLVQGTIGDLRVARAEFGFDLSHIPRATDWNQAGGGLLDLGIYCVQFLSH